MDNIISFPRTLHLGEDDYALVFRKLSKKEDDFGTQLYVPEKIKDVLMLEPANASLPVELVIFSMVAESFHDEEVGNMICGVLEEYLEWVAKGGKEIVL